LIGGAGDILSLQLSEGLTMIMNQVSSLVLAAATLIGWSSLWAQQQPAEPVAGSQQQGGRGGQGSGGGRGGGRASQMLFDAQCSGCHGGSDGAMGRAPNLFDSKWLGTVSDSDIQKLVRDGIPNTEMQGFSATQVNDQQLFELTAFLRTASANFAPKIEFVADPDGKVINSEKQKFRIEVLTRGLKTPFGLAFLPDGRLLITERDGDIRIYNT
jgi:mono/diheme cytochrome c family protein